MGNMADILVAATRAAVARHPKTVSRSIQYGTAGFRSKADELDSVMYRMGLLAALRSKATQATIGVMVTASHNPEEDNGVKLVDPMGDMLEAAWEILATHLVNADDAELVRTLEHIIFSTNLDMNALATVFVGKDTRQSSPALSQAVTDGVEVLGGLVQDFGLLTTPQLHYIVCCKNSRGKYGEPTEEGYYSKLAGAFNKLRGNEPNSGSYFATLSLDGANGVGALKMKKMIPYFGDSLVIEVHNDGSGKLNHLCGADYVKIQQKPPEGFPLEAGIRCVSFDGDGDRIIYFYLDKGGDFHLLDGDKIATLIATFLQELLHHCGIELNLGLVQTAYANGSSTDYIADAMCVPVACVSTGVKHLHHRAMQFDIGIYFEANGHGTVVFTGRAQQKIAEAAKSDSVSAEQKKAAHTLQNFMDIVNQTVGDAISDLLIVESILHSKRWSVEDWDQMYTDVPSRQIKLMVQDRTAITTTDAERKCVEPAGLQNAVDDLVSQYKQGRAFVRPSGTEDIVRIYAEADTQEAANSLAYQVCLKVYELAGGKGPKPQPP